MCANEWEASTGERRMYMRILKSNMRERAWERVQISSMRFHNVFGVYEKSIRREKVMWKCRRSGSQIKSTLRQGFLLKICGRRFLTKG